MLHLSKIECIGKLVFLQGEIIISENKNITIHCKNVLSAMET